MRIVDENGKTNTLSNLWCVDILTFRDLHEGEDIEDSVVIHSAFVHLDKYNISPVNDPIVSRFIGDEGFLGRQEQDGTYRYFYGEAGKARVIVQYHPWRRYIQDEALTRGSVTEAIVARDGDAFVRVNRWSLDEKFCKLEIIGGSRPNEESEDRSVMVFTAAEVRSLAAVLRNIINSELFYYFDDPLWREPLTKVAERNVGVSYNEWKERPHHFYAGED
jgi:hypothetical protein